MKNLNAVRSGKSGGQQSGPPRELAATLQRLSALGPVLNISIQEISCPKSDTAVLKAYYRQLLKNQKLAKKLEKTALDPSVKANGPIYALLNVYKHINEVITFVQKLRTPEEKHAMIVNNVFNPLMNQMVQNVGQVLMELRSKLDKADRKLVDKAVNDLTLQLQDIYDQLLTRLQVAIKEGL